MLNPRKKVEIKAMAHMDTLFELLDKLYVAGELELDTYLKYVCHVFETVMNVKK